MVDGGGVTRLLGWPCSRVEKLFPLMRFFFTLWKEWLCSRVPSAAAEEEEEGRPRILLVVVVVVVFGLGLFTGTEVERDGGEEGEGGVLLEPFLVLGGEEGWASAALKRPLSSREDDDVEAAALRWDEDGER